MFFNCSCDSDQLLTSQDLKWSVLTPYHPNATSFAYRVARVPFHGLSPPDVASGYALEDTNLIVKNPDYSDAGRYSCNVIGMHSERRDAEAIVLGMT